MDPNMTMNQSMSNMDASAQGPYSVTKITDGNAAVVATTTPPSGKNTDTLDIVALVLSVIALAVASKKRN
jgi:uncharacterized protein YcnI